MVKLVQRDGLVCAVWLIRQPRGHSPWSRNQPWYTNGSTWSTNGLTWFYNWFNLMIKFVQPKRIQLIQQLVQPHATTAWLASMIYSNWLNLMKQLVSACFGQVVSGKQDYFIILFLHRFNVVLYEAKSWRAYNNYINPWKKCSYLLNSGRTIVRALHSQTTFLYLNHVYN